LSKPGEHTTSIRLVEGPSNLPFLRIYVDSEFSRSYKVKNGIMVGGRDPAIDIPLEDVAISRKHFQLEYEGGNRLYIQDLGSHNGTYVNGERVVRAPLAHTDQIDLGRIVIIVSHPAHAPGTVIKFPSQKTDPGIELAKKKTAVVAQMPTEARIADPDSVVFKARPRVAPSPARESVLREVQRSTLGLVALTITLSALLGWGMYRWKISSSKSKSVAIVPLNVPIEPTEPLSEVPTATIDEVETETERRLAEDARPVIKKGEPVKRGPTGRGILDSLDKSLGSMRQDSLSGSEELLAMAPSKNSGNEKNLKKMRGVDPKRMALEIEMPRTQTKEGMEVASLGKEAANIKDFDAKAYHTDLRSRIVGIEECYVENARSETEAGSVSVWFSISLDGEIRKSGIEASTMRNKKLEDCIALRMTKVKAEPPPWDGFTATYTFKFGGRQKLKF
jgi:pSer/pThr/pTyr-binding forkhead associated (FHA) protein